MTATLAAATLVACSGGDDGGTEPTPAIGITLSGNTLSVTQGQTGSITVNLTRSGGFTGDVAVTVEGLPTGVTVTPATTTIGAAATSAVLNIAAAANATAATTNLTVRATGTGVTAQTAPLALTVTAAPAQSYTLAVGSSTISVAQGASNNTQVVNLTRTGGFNGAVALTAEGLPTGVTAAFNPASVTGATSTLTLTAAASAATGNSTITVRGTATGQTDKTATFTLTVTAANPGSYTLAVTPATVTVVQGASSPANIALTRTGGFTGSVAFAVEGLPTGVTGTFNPTSTTTDASVLTLAASATAAAGTTTITVRGTATGQTDKTGTFQLTVSAAAGFTLSMTPTSLTVAQGASGNSTVNITRTGGFAGTVNLTATGLPNGVTAAFNPAAAAGNSSALTLTASATATTGAATVTIRGNSGTLAEQTTTLALTVNQSSGGSGNTTWEFCTTSQTPIWFAVQDGATGTWTRVNPSGPNNTRFQFNVTQSKAGIAYVLQTGTPFVGSVSRSFASRLTADLQREMLLRNRPTRVSAYAARSLALDFALNILYGTQAELNGSGTTQCLPGNGKTVNGTVANVGAQQSAEISLGPESASAGGGAGNSFQLTNVPDGALDLVASRSTTTISGTNFSVVTDKLIIRRGVNAANNSTLPVLDFGAAEAFDPAQANITIANLGTDLALVTTAFFTAGGSSALGAGLSSFTVPSAGPFKYYGVPTSKMAAGDLHIALALAFPNLTTTDQARIAGLYFKDPTDRTVTLGAVLTAPTVSVTATTPYVRLRATGPIQAEYNQIVSIEYLQSTTNREVNIQASQAYLAGSANYDFTIPDFTGVAGWDNNWGLKAGAQTEWTVTSVGITGIGFGSPNPLEGSTFKGAFRTGTITP